MLLSSCPSIENLSIRYCFGLETLRVVNEPRSLKHIDVRGNGMRVEIELPTISTISMSCCRLSQCKMYLPHLVCVFLSDVWLSSESLDLFSCEFPCVQTMELLDCSGFKEFNLSSHSIKELSIYNPDTELFRKAAIRAPSIANFRYTGPVLESFSLETTSSEWKSDITLGGFYADSEKGDSEWFDNVNGLLKELRKSEICLRFNGARKIKKVNIDGVYDDPILVEGLMLRSWGCLGKYFPAFLDWLFCICRPRYIGEYDFFPNTQTGLNKDFEFIHEIFLKEGETRDRHSLWQHGLEEVSMEAFDRSINQRRCVQSTSSVEGTFILFRFRMKWSELRSQ